jgi:hypothetical protein
MPLPAGSLLEHTPQGLYCRAAAAWIDPWRPVPRALITPAHADHARPGCGEYWAVGASEAILRQRLGATINLLPVDYGATHRIGEARVSFHSAGHVLGSAQIRLEAGGESWLVSGDYKRCADPSCAPFEPVQADVFITEATFGLPIYRWQSGAAVAGEILRWQDAEGKTHFGDRPNGPGASAIKLTPSHARSGAAPDRTKNTERLLEEFAGERAQRHRPQGRRRAPVVDDRGGGGERHGAARDGVEERGADGLVGVVEVRPRGGKVERGVLGG